MKGISELDWHVTLLKMYMVELQAVVLQMLKKYKMKKKLLKLTVNTGQVMFSEDIYYYWSLNAVDKSLVKHRFSLHNLLRY